jgi:hypothetical protein
MPFIGFAMGFGFGVGCAFAVLYTIYTSGYRKAMEDYVEFLPKVQARLAKERAASHRVAGL